MFIQISCPIFNWVACFFTTEFYEGFFFEFLKYILDISLSNSGLQGQHLGLEGRIGFFCIESIEGWLRFVFWNGRPGPTAKFPFPVIQEVAVFLCCDVMAEKLHT